MGSKRQEVVHFQYYVLDTKLKPRYIQGDKKKEKLIASTVEEVLSSLGKGYSLDDLENYDSEVRLRIILPKKHPELKELETILLEGVNDSNMRGVRLGLILDEESEEEESDNKKESKSKAKEKTFDREFGATVEYHIEGKFRVGQKVNKKLVQVKGISKQEEKAIKEFLSNPSYDSKFVLDSIEKNGIIYIVGSLEGDFLSQKEDALKDVERLVTNKPIKTKNRDLYLY